MHKANIAKLLLAMGASGALALGAEVSLAASGGTMAPEASKTPPVSIAPGTSTKPEGKEMRAVRGHVTAVDPAAKTLSVKPTRGNEAEAIVVEVPDTVKAMEGKATKTLTGVKVGDRIWVKYDRMSDKLVADQIHILSSGKAASKPTSKNKSS